MKVLFLDLDGVVNTFEPYFLPELCAKIVRVLEATGAFVVLSSSWRKYLRAPLGSALWHDLAEGVLCEAGLPESIVERIISATRMPDENIPEDKLPRGHRADEIREWLAANPDVTHWAAVDDMGDWVTGLANLVLTSSKTGITDEDADLLIALLS